MADVRAVTHQRQVPGVPLDQIRELGVAVETLDDVPRPLTVQALDLLLKSTVEPRAWHRLHGPDAMVAQRASPLVFGLEQHEDVGVQGQIAQEEEQDVVDVPCCEQDPNPGIYH